MAEEQFTSRRARREAERLAAEQEFEARSTPAQPTETNRADLLTPPERPVEKPKAPAEAVQDSASRIDPAPAEKVAHERGALASDHLPQERPPVNAADRLDPRRAPLPHFESRAERKRYLREHGLSLDGDLSTGAIPVIAEPEESQPDADARPVEHESFDTAGFGGTSDEVAARDFESPVTPDSAPRPAAPEDAPARPTGSAPAEYTVAKPADAPGKGTMPNREESKAPDVKAEKTPAPGEKPAAQTDATPNTPAIKQAGTSATPAKTSDREATTRSRRMPIVQPPATKGVRVVTAASAQVSETTTETGARETEITETEVVETATASPTSTPRTGTTSPTDGAETAKKDARAGDEAEPAQSADDAARALAANPETRPMDAVPEAWALPNADYEDEETENPPGHRIKASAVTGHDGQILVGEEPSKVPFIVLGVAALFAVALIVIALVMLL
ncbi:hypothetical protein [Brevibacterium casei]|uniref:hypothetical protein n=1 Tax=Brevibacterium casei TaxID=33889 RepID=UPI002468C47F|nr:hypothetical protein [Brevibacterium casei]MDH5148820.1 hypothetical protein [Brevibacterium casei]